MILRVFKLAFLLLCSLAITSLAAAQFTTVSGTIIDPNGIPYANALVSAVLVTSASPTFTATAQPYTPPTQPAGTNTAGFFFMNLADNTALSPAGTKWNFKVSCAAGCILPSGGKGPQAFTLPAPITISGASQNISANLNAVAPALGFVGAGSGSGSLTPIAVAGLNSVSGKTDGTTAAVFDGANFSDCTVGGGILPVLCQYNGSVWADNAWPMTPTVGTSTIGGQATLVPAVSAGEILATNDWLNLQGAGIFAPAPSLAFATSGGALSNGTVTTQITISNANGESYPSLTSSITLSSCTGGTQCLVTVTAPALASGQTYTVYDAEGGALKQQTPNCVNITTNCVISSIAGGGSPPTKDASAVYPSAWTNDCSPSNPALSFIQLADLTWHSALGINRTESVTGYTNRGTLEFCRPIIVNNTGSDDTGALNGTFNVFGQVNPTQAPGAGNVFGQQIEFFTPASFTGTQSTQTEGLYVENFDLGTASHTMGGGEAAIGAIRGTAYVPAGTNVTFAGPTYSAVKGVSGFAQNLSTTVNCSPTVVCFAGVEGVTQQNAATGSTFPYFVGVMGSYNKVAQDNNSRGFALYAKLPPNLYSSASTAAYNNVGVFVDNFTNCGGCWGGYFNGNAEDLTQSPVFVNGIVWLGGLKNSSLSPINTLGSFVNTGSYGTGQLGTPSAPSITHVGTTGSTLWTYGLAYVDGNGNTGPISTVTGDSGGFATLSVSNYEHVCDNTSHNWQVSGTSKIAVYRTVASGTPNTTGFIGFITNAAYVAPGQGINSTQGNNYALTAACLDDTGLAGDTFPAPTVDTTGGVNTTGIVKAATGTGNTVFVSSDFTSAANTTLQTITGLTLPLPKPAGNYAFHCSLTYSQATAATSMQFGIQSATIAPTQINAKARVDTSAAAVASGVLNGLVNKLATAIITFTPSAAVTIFGADIDGMIENPTAGSGNAVNIMVQTSNSSDLPTVKRGSYCSLLP